MYIVVSYKFCGNSLCSSRKWICSEINISQLLSQLIFMTDLRSWWYYYSSVCRWGEWGSGKLRNLSRVTQQASNSRDHGLRFLDSWFWRHSMNLSTGVYQFIVLPTVDKHAYFSVFLPVLIICFKNDKLISK